MKVGADVYGGLETILRSERRSRPMLVGWLLERLVETAKELWPEFAPYERREPLKQSTLKLAPQVEKPKIRLPHWIRRLTDGDDEDQGQSLAEYVVVLALVAIVAIVALLFMGQALSQAISSIGESIQ